MNETMELRYEPVEEGMFPLLGKIYAEAWKGANSAFSTPAHLKKRLSGLKNSLSGRKTSVFS